MNDKKKKVKKPKTAAKAPKQNRYKDHSSTGSGLSFAEVFGVAKEDM